MIHAHLIGSECAEIDTDKIQYRRGGGKMLSPSIDLSLIGFESRTDRNMSSIRNLSSTLSKYHDLYQI